MQKFQGGLEKVDVWFAYEAWRDRDTPRENY